MLRVRFAPSPTGFLHVGSARTYIFNWLYARHNGGTMVLRVDDTDVERNTEASLNSIFEGLNWLGLGWDEQYRQSERLSLHHEAAGAIFQRGMAYRDFTPAHTGDSEKSGAQGTSTPAGAKPAPAGGPGWLFNADMRQLSREESDRRAAAGEPFALRFRVPRDTVNEIRFTDAVYGDQAKSTADIEDFALLRSDGMPTYHLASCADDADLKISHIIRGQDHLTNTFKHILIFEALGANLPQFAHLPLLVAPDGTKLSKRRHGPVVSVTTYRDAGFLPEAFVNFLCLLGWSPKNDREVLSRQELVDLFSLEGINRANAVVNFKEPPSTPDDTFDPKALWLNAEHIRALPVDELSQRLLPVVEKAGFHVDADRMKKITPLVRERIRLLNEVLTVADFILVDELPPYDPAELIPQKGDAAMALKALTKAREVLAHTEFSHDPLDQALRAAAQELGLKAGQMFQPIRVAVCGKKNAPPLFETLEVLGKKKVLERTRLAIHKMGGSTVESREMIVDQAHTRIRRKYHNPPIIQAVCEFQFIPSGEWDWTIPGLVYQQIEKEFPQKRQEKALEITIEAQQQGAVAQNVGSSLSKMQFLRPDNSAMVQVGPNLLAVNAMRPYPGWETLRDLIERQFRIYSNIANPKGYRRIGLRYINQVVLPTLRIEMTDYFNYYPHLPETVEQLHGPFAMRVLHLYENGRDTLNLQMAHSSAPSTENLAIALDLDYSVSQAGEIELSKGIEWVDQAHERIEQMFEACITDRTRALLEVTQ